MATETVTKIDTAEKPDDSQVRGWYKRLMESVYQIDDVLDAQADAASGGKRKFTNELVDNSKTIWEPVVTRLQEQLRDKMNEEQRAGAFYGFIRSLSETFKDDIDKWIATQIEQRPKVEVETISEEEKKKLQEDRSNFVKQIRAIIEMAYTFGEAEGDMTDQPDPNWPQPKIRFGSVGKRGKRALTLFTWTVDGNPMPEDDDSVKGVSTLLGFPLVAEFTKALRDSGVNTTNPPDSFEKEIKGKVVTATRITEEMDSDPTEPDNGDEDESEEDDSE